MTTFYYVPGLGNVQLENGAYTMAANRIGAIGSDLSRELGIERDIKRNARFATALTTPGQFVTDRNDALTALRNKLDKDYADMVIDLVKTDGLSNEDATSAAKKVIKAQYEMGLKRIESEYPVNVEKLVKGKFEGKI